MWLKSHFYLLRNFVFQDKKYCQKNRFLLIIIENYYYLFQIQFIIFNNIIYKLLMALLFMLKIISSTLNKDGVLFIQASKQTDNCIREFHELFHQTFPKYK